MKEEWKDIPGWEGHYQVSSMGNVKSVARYFINRWGGKTFIKEKIKSQRLDGKGYPRVTFSLGRDKISGKINHYTFPTHKLVAMTFITNTENKPCINHIDGNPINNNVSNLEWVTYAENTQHAVKIGRWDNVKKVNSKRLKTLHQNKDNRLRNYV